PDTANIPVIALTATTTLATHREQFDGYLCKPISINALFKELSRYLKYTTEFPKNDWFEDKDITDIPILISKLEDMQPLLQEVTEVIEIDVIDDLVKQIITLANTHNSKKLLSYAKELGKFSKSFDIVNIEITLEKFPDILKNIGNS
ncbi:hypothetical protein QUF50_09270, partial [Thiotrichales bacterium HSG1]|nr:hypothetical protein [Thiotrichales bacterium HSG1]